MAEAIGARNLCSIFLAFLLKTEFDASVLHDLHGVEVVSASSSQWENPWCNIVDLPVCVSVTVCGCESMGLPCDELATSSESTTPSPIVSWDKLQWVSSTKLDKRL